MAAPQDFAKIYNHPSIGQILVIRDADDNGNPSVTFTIDAGSIGLGICSIGIKSGNWAYVDKYFEAVTQEKAFFTAEKLMGQITEFGYVPDNCC